jgi:hypothetical protein
MVNGKLKIVNQGQFAHGAFSLTIFNFPLTIDNFKVESLLTHQSYHESHQNHLARMPGR